MKKVFVVCILAALLAIAQQTRHDETRSSGAAEDARPNSASVPEAVALTGKLDHVVVMRFKYQTELLSGMEKLVKEQHIKNAVILSGIGSVRNYQVHAVANRTLPSVDAYTKDPTAPADIVGMNGYVINGVIHCHMMMADPQHAFGGHLEPGTNVFTFVAVTMGVLADGIDIGRIDDKTWR
jgi:uncharacterized protein